MVFLLMTLTGEGHSFISDFTVSRLRVQDACEILRALPPGVFTLAKERDAHPAKRAETSLNQLVRRHVNNAHSGCNSPVQSSCAVARSCASAQATSTPQSYSIPLLHRRRTG